MTDDIVARLRLEEHWTIGLCDQAADEIEQMRAVLKDPVAVHVNILRGGIAKLTPQQIGHLYRGDDALAVVAEVKRQNPDVFFDADEIKRLGAESYDFRLLQDALAVATQANAELEQDLAQALAALATAQEKAND